ncbi:hypothetical protein SAMN06295905_1418 [Devosia lucknowensis]|uniref:Uncharacterized protein n=1 Tax=Devosia lucknowensis TaxID=1096929 RepID=A0A1Y6EU02_9HYPH|nr:hypothetical protein [Devosia lucknowensis]SMQ66194.1 hypothetical protein SAMN06295905_1418 [Devosia lucknowensis]
MTNLSRDRFERQNTKARRVGQATVGKTVQFVMDASLPPLAKMIEGFMVEASAKYR